MPLMAKLNIEKRVWILCFIFMTFFISLIVYDTFEYKESLKQGKLDKLSSVVSLAESIIDDQYQRLSRGEITEQQAKDQSKTLINKLRYDDNEYLWLHDTDNNMVAHPIKPELTGTSVATIKDAKGEYLFAKMTKLAIRDGAGEIDYYWPKPGSKKPVAKISYVKQAKHWNWIIGSGVYVDDIETEFAKAVMSKLIVLAVIFVISLAVVVKLISSIVKPIKKTTAAMNNIASGDGDLTQRLNTEGEDELAALSLAFNTFTENVQKVIKNMGLHGDHVVEQAEQLQQSCETSSAAMLQNRHETEQVATAVYQMSATINEVAQNAQHASSSVNTVKEQSDFAQHAVAEGIDTINQLADSVKQASTTISKLALETENIGSILDVIRGIAEQTNLLALNAAIEAARAGEQGRGFAVVADEVRSLAKRTQDATEEIQVMIEQLQAGAHSAVEVIGAGAKVADTSVTTSAKVGEALAQIGSGINQVSDMSVQIASATEEQSATIELINKNVDSINHSFAQSTETSHQVSHSSTELKAVADDMHSLIKTFKV